MAIETDPTMLERAKALVYGERQQDYGAALENFTRIARIWEVVLGVSVSPEQVALCMIGVKMARLVKSPEHEDSWVDIAGYVGCVDKLKQGL